MRLFVAIELDPGLRRALARAWESHAPDLPRAGGLRPVGEERLHVTVRFVGETSDDRITDVIDAANAAAAAVPPFAFRVRGLGGFPKPQLARVLWAGIEPCKPLAEIVRRVEAELRARGFPPEPRGFSPHITLARAKGAPIRLATPLDPVEPSFGEQEVDALTVMESRLSPRGSIYVPVASSDLVEEAPRQSGPEAGP